MGDGTDPKNIVNTAKRTSKEDGIKYDQIFCVFDRDNQPSAFVEAIELCKSRKFIPIVSNPCFEIWPFLHFQLRESGFGDPQQVLKFLKKLSGFEDYDKDGVQIFKSTVELVNTACKHATLLTAKQSDDPKRDPLYQCSSSYQKILNAQKRAKLLGKMQEIKRKENMHNEALIGILNRLRA